MVEQMTAMGNGIPMVNRKITYRFGNIVNADLNKNAFYDLDFCNRVYSVVDILDKFRDQKFMVTFALRKDGLQKAVADFVSAVGEKVVSDIPHPQHNLLKTNKNDYIYSSYHDSMVMLNIFKFH